MITREDKPNLEEEIIAHYFAEINKQNFKTLTAGLSELELYKLCPMDTDALDTNTLSFIETLKKAAGSTRVDLTINFIKKDLAAFPFIILRGLQNGLISILDFEDLHTIWSYIYSTINPPSTGKVYQEFRCYEGLSVDVPLNLMSSYPSSGRTQALLAKYSKYFTDDALFPEGLLGVAILVSNRRVSGQPLAAKVHYLRPGSDLNIKHSPTKTETHEIRSIYSVRVKLAMLLSIFDTVQQPFIPKFVISAKKIPADEIAKDYQASIHVVQCIFPLERANITNIEADNNVLGPNDYKDHEWLHLYYASHNIGNPRKFLNAIYQYTKIFELVDLGLLPIGSSQLDSGKKCSSDVFYEALCVDIFLNIIEYEIVKPDTINRPGIVLAILNDTFKDLMRGYFIKPDKPKPSIVSELFSAINKLNENVNMEKEFGFKKDEFIKALINYIKAELKNYLDVGRFFRDTPYYYRPTQILILYIIQVYILARAHFSQTPLSVHDAVEEIGRESLEAQIRLSRHYQNNNNLDADGNDTEREVFIYICNNLLELIDQDQPKLSKPRSFQTSSKNPIYEDQSPKSPPFYSFWDSVVNKQNIQHPQLKK